MNSSASSPELDSLDLKLTDEEAGKEEYINGKGKFDLGAFVKKNKLSVGLAMAGIFLLGVGVLSTIALSSKQETSIEILPASSAAENQDIFVHIAGAVEKPGLYRLLANARVNDALIASGGLSAQADREWFAKTVNLAQKLTDGAKLYIPEKNSTLKSDNSELSGEVAGNQTSIFQETQGKINLNTATISQLETLPGIGPSFAQRIIDYRSANGLFNSIEDIQKVSGIGEKTFEKIKDKITTL